MGDAPYDPNSRFHPHGWKPVLGNKRKEGKGHTVNFTSETSKFENLKQRKGQRKVSNPARSAFVGVAANEPRFTRGNSFSKPPKAKPPRYHQRQVKRSRKQRRQRRERSRSPPRRKEESIEELTLLLHGFDAHQAFTETAGQSIKKSMAETIISLQNTIKKLEIQRKYQNKLLTLHLQRVPKPMQGDCEAIFLESVYCKTPFETVTKHPPTNLFESLGYSMNTLDKYKARILKIQEKLTQAEHERQQVQKEYEHYTRDYLRFVSQHLVSDRFAPPAPQERRNQQSYARAFMAQVIEDPDNEANAPTPRASASTTDPVNITATSNATVPFVPGDGSASSITAPADEQLPVPTTPPHTPAPSFGLPPLSASRASEIMLELQNRANEARLANNLSLASGGGGESPQLPQFQQVQL